MRSGSVPIPAWINLCVGCPVGRVHVSHTSSSIFLRSLSRIASSTFSRILWSSRTSNMRQSTTARSATINSTPITSLMPTIVRILPQTACLIRPAPHAPHSNHHPCCVCENGVFRPSEDSLTKASEWESPKSTSTDFDQYVISSEASR